MAWGNCTTINYAPVFQIQMPNEEEREIGDFRIDEILVMEEGDLDVNAVVANIIPRMNFFPGMVLGRKQLGI